MFLYECCCLKYVGKRAGLSKYTTVASASGFKLSLRQGTNDAIKTPSSNLEHASFPSRGQKGKLFPRRTYVKHKSDGIKSLWPVNCYAQGLMWDKHGPQGKIRNSPPQRLQGCCGEASQYVEKEMTTMPHLIVSNLGLLLEPPGMLLHP